MQELFYLWFAFNLTKENYMGSSFLYITSIVLDEFDGIATRRYNQGNLSLSTLPTAVA